MDALSTTYIIIEKVQRVAMGGIQLRKIIRDITKNANRVVLVIIGIAWGVLGIGLILNSFAVIGEEVSRSFVSTNPASFSLWFDRVDDELIRALESFEKIEYIEDRRMLRSRINTDGNEWVTTLLYVVDDFSNLKVNTFTLEEGARNPGAGEILIERMSLALSGYAIDDYIDVKIPLYDEQELKLAGRVHAAGLKPAWIEEIAYGFITKETYALLGDSTDFCQVLFTVADGKMDKGHIEEVMLEVRGWCSQNGYRINRVEVPTPGKHPNGDQIDALLFLFESFGFLSLALGSVVVINLISAILSTQIRQIGIMKAVGASKKKIASMYYAIVLLFGMTAVIVAIPFAALLSRGIVSLCSEFLNFNVSNYKIPLYSYGIQLISGIIIPMLAATVPILRGCSTTVNKALHEYNVTKRVSKQRKESGFAHVGIAIKLAIRNTFRRSQRFVHTIVTLFIGGAVFVTALNLFASLNSTIDIAMDCLKYDNFMIFSKDYAISDIEGALSGSIGVADYEIYGGAMASVIYDDGTQSESYLFLAFPEDAKGFDLKVMEGVWLSNPSSNEAVVNHMFLDSEPECSLGDEITVLSNQRLVTWKIVGVVKEVGANPMIYANLDYYQKEYEKEGMGREVVVFYQDNMSGDERENVTQNIENRFKTADIDVQSKQTIEGVSTVFANHLRLLAGFLVVASILIMVVGCISLISSTGINIIERMRELGVMRSMGASPGKIVLIFVYESAFTSIVSFVFSCLFALPLTLMLCSVFGHIFLKTPLDMAYSASAAALLLLITSVVNAIISAYLSRKAMQQPVYDIIGSNY